MNRAVPMGDYRVVCQKCGQDRDRHALRCPNDDSLLKTVYSARQLVLRPYPGMWRFFDWLPVNGILGEVHSGPVTYKSEGLAKEIGLDQLYITFNGYWPERGADMLSCSFKELEALPTMRRLEEQGGTKILVVATAGNTGRAFSYIASLIGRPVVIVVPQDCHSRIWIPNAERNKVLVVAVRGDYYDAIVLGDRLAALPGFAPEGGARNVARRDGMGTVILDAVQFIGSLPNHYFQAVGSGTGGISAFEASQRLIVDGRFGDSLPILHLAQSIPCAPLIQARYGVSFPKSCPQGIFDDVLFNRRPPYDLPGGVKWVLDRTGGEVLGITNDEAASAKRLFEEVEGIDILPAPAVAVAALMKSALNGGIKARETCLLNITGGGRARVCESHGISVLAPDWTVRPDQDAEELGRKIKEACGRRN
jgi:cysteate synthase